MIDYHSPRVRYPSLFLGLIMLFVMFFRPYPSEQLGGLVRQVFILLPVMASFYLFWIYAFRAKCSEVTVKSHIVFFVGLIWISMFLAVILSVNDMNLRGLAELARPFYFLFSSLLFYQLANQRISRIFLSFIIAFAILQVFLAGLQLTVPYLMIPLNYIYSLDKVSPHIMRAVGTLGNPNIMAMYILAAVLAADIVLRARYFYLLLPFLILGVAMSGSVFAVVILFVVLGLIFGRRLIASCRHSYFNMAMVLILFPVTIIGIALIFRVVVEYMPRFADIITLIGKLQHAGQLLEFHNLAARISTWQKAFTFFSNIVMDKPIVLLFGAGPQKNTILGVLDNDYLFVFLRYGLFGITLYLFGLIYILRQAFKKNDDISVFTRRLLFLMMASSLFYDSLSSWSFMPLYLPAISLMFGARIHEKYAVDYAESPSLS